MSSLQKVMIHKSGSYEQLRVEAFSKQELMPSDVRVSVHAVGVNYADCVVRMGLYEPAKKYMGWPITPGFEVAGVVTEVGDEVSSFAPGDRVIAVTRFGGYTSELVVSEHQVFVLPDNLSMEEGASIMTVFLTAYYAIANLAACHKGQRVLIHSAAGGVGSALVQLARNLGCFTVGVVGASHKVDYPLELGADHVIDKSKEDLWGKARTLSPDGYHAIFDANGVSTLQQSKEHLASPGRLVIYGFHSMLPKDRGRPNWLKLAWDYLRTPRFSPLELTGSNHAVMGFNLAYLFEEIEMMQESVSYLLQEFAEERLAAPQITTYPLQQVAEAHKALESAQTIGKLILVP
ncbi:MAG: zinc-binding dehydrogenase [Deltaproteobacteria bacterium]|nr:MAG: zinc-binding dehydrogenase [Deltaproteobacteria bacterium]